jgi:hypothetical protein
VDEADRANSEGTERSSRSGEDGVTADFAWHSVDGWRTVRSAVKEGGERAAGVEFRWPRKLAGLATGRESWSRAGRGLAARETAVLKREGVVEGCCRVRVQ